MGEPPDTLVAELTYACPLRCGYCSNPTASSRAQLSTEEWTRVIEEAAALGVLQLHFTGGEPLLRDDLEVLVAAARRAELYTNLITSGVPLTQQRLAELARVGIDHVQLSFQAANEAANDALAGSHTFSQKMQVARWVKELGLRFTINVVLHRQNLDDVRAIIALADTLGAERLELANTQYLGSALLNRDLLLPSSAQLDHARRAIEEARAGKPEREILFVLPDYFAGRPRACMGGWAKRYLVIAPDGRALPCHAAAELPLPWERVVDHSLAALWSGPAFAQYRGEAWMQEPCRSCDRRSVDFGGCRCQAFALTGDAAATDPACTLAPSHALVTHAHEAAHGNGTPHRRLKLL